MKIIALLALLLGSVVGQDAASIRTTIGNAQASLPSILTQNPFTGTTYQNRARNAAATNLVNSGFNEEKIINYYVLACIYYSTNGANWLRKNNWITTSDTCNWFGLNCYLDNLPAAVQAQQQANGLVLEILLDSNRLNGNWPFELALMGSYLVTIDVYNNTSLNCNGYAWFSEMTALNFLYFGSTSWSANGIPTLLNNLSELRELEISDSMWTAGPIRANAFSSLSQLRYLDMGGNTYTTGGAATLPTTITNLPNLQRFYLDGATFTGGRYNLNFLSNMNRILEAWMDDTLFQGSIPRTMPRTLASFSCVYCGLSGSLPQLQGSNMNRLWLYGNSLTGTIPASWGNLDMDYLYLEGNKLSTTSVIPAGLCAQRGTAEGTLQELGVDCNIQCSCCTCCGQACGNLGPANPPLFCFSGESEMEVEQRGTVKMSDLVLGDYVRVADNKYEPVYSFGHKDAESVGDYLQVVTEGERSPIEISADHMMMVDGDRAIPASMLKKGDLVVTASGETAAVKSIKKVVRKGAFAPFTESGTMVVNDLVASNYIAYQGSEYLTIGGIETPFSYQWLAHTFNSAHRLAVMMGFKCESYTDTGVSHWVDVPHKVGSWLFEQNVVISLAVLLPAIALFGFLHALETLIKSCSALSLIVIMVGTLCYLGKGVLGEFRFSGSLTLSKQGEPRK